MIDEAQTLRHELERLHAEKARLQALLEESTRRQAALRETAERYRQAIESGGIGTWRIEPSGGGLSLDAVAARLLLDADEPQTIWGAAWAEFVAAEDRQRVVEAIEECRAGRRERLELEFRTLRAAQPARWVLMLGGPVADTRPPGVCLSGVVRDISFQKRAERLHKGQTRVLESIAAGAGLHDSLCKLVRMIQDCSDGMLGSVLVLDEDRRRLWTAAAPDLPESYTRAINGVEIGPCVGACGSAAYRRQRVICEDIAHDPLWEGYRELALAHGLAACWSEPILSAGGDVLGTFALYYRSPRGPTPVDLELISLAAHIAGIAITSKRTSDTLLATNRALERAHARLDAIINGAPIVAIQGYDRSGRVVFWNRASEQFYGYTAQQAVGRRLGEFLLTPERAAAFEKLLREVTAPGGAAVQHECVVHTRGGQTRHVLASIFPVPGPDGGTQCICVDIDITERKRLEQQLLHSMKMEGIGRLAGGIAHDFNNLLTAILGYTELTQRALSPDDPARTNLQQIHRAADRASELTRHLLAFARRQIIEPRIVRLNDLVQDMERMLRRLIGEHIELHSELAPDLWTVEVDPGQFEQIVVNLAVNARDAMPGGGRLTLQTANVPADSPDPSRPTQLPPSDYVTLAVQDTGVGMSPETLERIFEPFFTTKEGGAGTGLGLATAYGIVKQAGGEIEVDSAPDRGSRFRIWLPRAAERPARQPEPEHKPPALEGGETILLVEDEPLVRELAETALRAHGYNVLVAESGQTALAIASQWSGPIHLLLTDVVLPGLRGRDFADRLRHARPGLKVLYMSGHPDDELTRQGTIDNVALILPKPFTPTSLAAKVREVLNAP